MQQCLSRLAGELPPQQSPKQREAMTAGAVGRLFHESLVE